MNARQILENVMTYRGTESIGYDNRDRESRQKLENTRPLSEMDHPYQDKQ